MRETYCNNCERVLSNLKLMQQERDEALDIAREQYKALQQRLNESSAIYAELEILRARSAKLVEACREFRGAAMRCYGEIPEGQSDLMITQRMICEALAEYEKGSK